MSRIVRAAVVGAALLVGGSLLDAGLEFGAASLLKEALYPSFWFLFGMLAFLGAFAGVSVFLAWQHARTSPRWLYVTLICLLALSTSIVTPFVRETRATRRFLATADSTRGVVTSKFVRGAVYIVVDYRVAGRPLRVRKRGQNPLIGSQAFSGLDEGDTVSVYYQPVRPDLVVIATGDPEVRFLIELLAKMWIICGVLLTAYLPLVARMIRSLRRPASGASQVPQYQS